MCTAKQFKEWMHGCAHFFKQAAFLWIHLSNDWLCVEFLDFTHTHKNQPINWIRLKKKKNLNVPPIKYHPSFFFLEFVFMTTKGKCYDEELSGTLIFLGYALKWKEPTPAQFMSVNKRQVSSCPITIHSLFFILASNFLFLLSSSSIFLVPCFVISFYFQIPWFLNQCQS